MFYSVFRYSDMNYRGNFQVAEGESPLAGQYCLLKSPRGVEIGKALCDVIEHHGEVQWKKRTREHNDGAESPDSPLKLAGEVLRVATDSDLDSMARLNRNGTDEEMEFCKQCIKAHGLKMKLAGVEYLFEGEKIIFYFLADGRIDFRALVRDLAKKYRTRIEMKQIGVRDEARLLAEYEHCGRRLCCKNFLNHLEPVTMKMAKCQKTTLDPSKISGRCGRLMCCLRYEDNVYQELKNVLPKKGAIIKIDEGRAKVLSQDILLQKLVVETVSGERQIIHQSEIVSIEPPTNQAPPRARSKKKKKSSKPKKKPPRDKELLEQDR